MHEVLQSWSPNTVYQLLLELRGIRGGKGVLRRQGKREGAFNLRGGAICRGLMVLPLANRDWINLCLNGKKCQGRGYRGWADPDGVDKTWIRLINPRVTLQKLFHEVSTKSPNHCQNWFFFKKKLHYLRPIHHNVITINWPWDTTRFDSEDDCRTGCHCQHHSLIQDYTHPDDQSPPTYEMLPLRVPVLQILQLNLR